MWQFTLKDLFIAPALVAVAILARQLIQFCGHHFGVGVNDEIDLLVAASIIGLLVGRSWKVSWWVGVLLGLIAATVGLCAIIALLQRPDYIS